MKAIITVALALLVACASSQDILTVLGQQDGIEQFRDMLAGYPDLVDYLNTGVHTLVVPSDSAVDRAKSSMPDSFADNSSVRALLDYHILNDTHPIATFTNLSHLVPTHLTNTTYTNVTGGQRVELRKKEGKAAFVSALKAVSKVTQGDIFYVGGLVHIVDSVLQIPLAFPSTITQANLTYLVALLNKGNWLTPTSLAYKLALETADITILGPNAQAYGADFTGWEGLSQAQLDQIFLYHSLPELVYTPDMTNGSQFATLANLSITARDYVGPLLQSAIFLDQAQVTGSNYLTANGVLHIIDRPLDPSNPNATPAQADVYVALGLPPPGAGGNGISTGSIVGIVIGVLAVLTATALIFALRFRMRRKRRQYAPTFSRAVSSPSRRQMSPDYPPAMGDVPIPGNYSRSAKQTFIITPARLGAPLPARPQPVAENIAPVRGALWPSRPPANGIVELDAKEYHMQMDEFNGEESGAVQSGSNNGGSEKAVETRPPPTPPELDGKEMSRSESMSAGSQVSITSHGERLRHIGFQAQC